MAGYDAMGLLMGDLREWRAGSLIAFSDEGSGTDEGRSDETSTSRDVCVSVSESRRTGK